MPTYLVVGLGNPGDKYDHTRHNAGFDVLTLLSAKLDAPIKRLRHRALLGKTQVEGHKVLLAKPQTYMNLSGEAVRGLMDWYKVQPEHLLVIYDDVDLPPGTLRIRSGGSGGTHNGMRSIIQEIGTQAFPRIRVGIGDQREDYDLADWVLSHYNTPQERQVAYDAYAKAADAALEYLRNGIDSAMRLYNPPKQKKERPAKEEAVLPTQPSTPPSPQVPLEGSEPLP